VLDEGRAVRSIEGLNEGESAIIRSYGLVTAKPVLYVANVGEDDVASGGGDAARQVATHAEADGAESVVICAKLEEEIAELDDADRDEMLESMGLAEPAIGPLARGLLSILGYGCFYTAGEKEIRAWPIPIGATAPESAGTVHSDIERGFIRAECYSIDDLVEHKSEKAIRDAGRLRSEGKNYQMQDGDVVHFLFNV
jgi:ribosome-binding ATPase YchF (GTP1/OBG family)